MRKSNIFTSLLGTIALIVVVYVAYTQFNSYLKTKSINDCMQAAKVELRSEIKIGQTNYVTTRTQPVTEWYERCIREKGYISSK